MTRPLSPAALAVVDAVMMHQFGVSSCLARNERMRSGGIAAAALRAAADAVDAEQSADAERDREMECFNFGISTASRKLRAIANELDLHD